jgi:hypothetical protein
MTAIRWRRDERGDKEEEMKATEMSTRIEKSPMTSAVVPSAFSSIHVPRNKCSLSAITFFGIWMGIWDTEYLES